MTVIAFLACETTLPAAEAATSPNTPERRVDAFEHDLMVAALKPAFKARGLTLEVIDWEAPISAFAGVALALIGTTWNYWDKSQAFLDKLDALEARGVTVCNPPSLVRWNITKTYLRELETAGVRTIPTLWHEDVSGRDVSAAVDTFACERVVVKRQVGAGAEGQELFVRGNLPGPSWRFGHPAMIQPFLPAITNEGEISFIFIDGSFSHALIKRAADGDYRIQSLYGGREEVFAPSPQDIAAADAVQRAVPFDCPLYARIDMVRMVDGALALMEAEMIEPYLYPEQGPQLGERIADAVLRRVMDQ